jgi:transcriptional regulator with XRE-family HTH domain
MNIGEKIKQLRTDKNLTQPQLAEAIGIEQSYLSKLENDKSVPSADIFQAILKALAVDVGSFLEGIDEKIIHRQLRQIPEVANYLNAGVAYKIHNIKKWLFCSAAACVIGLTLIVAGYRGIIFSNYLYNYISEGIILAGEPTNIFREHSNISFTRMQANEITSVEMRKLESEFAIKRINEQRMLLNDYRGDDFMLPVEGGTRIYHLSNSVQYESIKNRSLMFLGIFLALSGLFGFFVEFRLRKI